MINPNVVDFQYGLSTNNYEGFKVGFYTITQIIAFKTFLQYIKKCVIIISSQDQTPETKKVLIQFQTQRETMISFIIAQAHYTLCIF